MRDLQVIKIPSHKPGSFVRTENLNSVWEYLTRLDPDKAFNVSISESKPRRSLPQNSLLYALESDALRLGGEALGGYTKEDVHELMLIEHYGANTTEVFGRKRLKPKRRSSDLNKQEMTDHLDFVVRFFAEHGIVLSLPDDP